MQDPTLREREAPPDASALEELRDDHTERRRFLKMLGAGGAAGTFGLLLAACGSSSTDTNTVVPAGPLTKTKHGMEANHPSDLDIVNYALTLEHLETDFYTKVVASGLFKGGEAKTIKQFGAEEAQHVKALKAVANQLGKAKPSPTFKFPPMKDKKSVLKLAATVENLGAAAYLGAAPMISDKQILAAALTIHSVEGRHAATLNDLLGMSPTPTGAFAQGAGMSDVLAKVKPFIASS